MAQKMKPCQARVCGSTQGGEWKHITALPAQWAVLILCTPVWKVHGDATAKDSICSAVVVPADSRHAHRRHAYDVGAPMPEDSPSVVSARQQGAASIAKWVQECNMLKTSTPLSNPADLFDLDYALGGYIAKINDTMIGSQVFTNQSVLKPDQEYVSVGQIIWDMNSTA